MKLYFKHAKKLKESVSWDYYNSPEIEAIEKKYLPAQGEGDTMATQACTAITKLIYRWYNDGDVYDNVNSYLEGWGNDLSSYANWLYKYVPESRHILEGIYNMSEESDYEDLLKELNDNILNQETMSDLETKKSVGSIYNCDGPFEWDYRDEEDEEIGYYPPGYYDDFEEEDEEYYESFKKKRRMNEANKDSKLGSVEDYLDKLSHCKSKSEAEKIIIKAAGNPNASEAYRRWKVMKGLDESKKRMNEGYVTDYIDSEKLHNMMNDPGFGDYTLYKQLPNMTVRTDKLINKAFPGAENAYKSRFWKFIKNDDGSWEVNEVDENNNLVEPRVNFVLTESKNRMNESYPSASSYVQPAREAIAAITSLLNMMYEDQMWYDDSSDVDYYEEVRDRLNDLLDWAKQG